MKASYRLKNTFQIGIIPSLIENRKQGFSVAYNPRKTYKVYRLKLGKHFYYIGTWPKSQVETI